MFSWLRRLLGRAQPGKSLGEAGEDLAAQYLRAEGLRILVRNYRCVTGEIDIIALDGDTLVFVEVKTRRASQPPPEIQIDRAKQHQLTRAARRYLSLYGSSRPAARFDVVAIVWPDSAPPQVRHIRGAFEATF